MSVKVKSGMGAPSAYTKAVSSASAAQPRHIASARTSASIFFMRIAPFTFCGFHRSLTKIIRGKMHDVNRKNFINTIGVRNAPFFVSNSSEEA